MIARLTGLLSRKDPTRVVIDVGGVGYEVQIPLSTFYTLPEQGGAACLEIHTHVREEAITLFGFATGEEKALFELLIGVSGVGPKLACTLLSGLAPVEVVSAIRSGEAARLQGVPGIGRKTAERIVLDLRDRLDRLSVWMELPVAAGERSDEVSDAISALVNLGYKEVEARRVVEGIAAGAPGAPDTPGAPAPGGDGQRPVAGEGVEGLLRMALRTLAGDRAAGR